MKRVIFSTVFFLGLTSFAGAQTNTGNASTTTGAASNTSEQAKNKKAKPSERLNNRRIYRFKNGQKSTPTGNEATPVGGGGYAAIGRNQSGEIKGDTLVVEKPAAAATNRKTAAARKKKTQ